jgi:purine-binding chemotaxis protein CheW
MNKKSKIKSTLDSLFTGGKVSSGEEIKKVSEPEIQVESPKPPSVEKSAAIPKKEPAEVKPQQETEKILQTQVPVVEIKNNTGAVLEKEKVMEPAVQPSSPMPEPVVPKPQLLTQEKNSTETEIVQRIANEIDLAAVATDGDEEHLVIFTLGKELYGVTIHAVESIIKLQSITQVPRTAAFILGVTNLRGTVVPVLDLRRRFNLPDCENTTNTRIVIVNAEGSKVGIVVDEVTEVLKVSRNAIQPPPPMSTTIESAFINGIARINDRLVILLDLEKVLASSIRQHNR